MTNGIDITEHIAAINRAASEVATIAEYNALSHDKVEQDFMAAMMAGASVRLAELRTLLLLAAGGGLKVPDVLRPLQEAISHAVKATEDIVMAGYPAANFEESVAVFNESEKALVAARLAGVHLLGHLGSVIGRIERQRAAQLQAVESGTDVAQEQHDRKNHLSLVRGH